tara:strand:- start:73 stop:210 length:138 start_codon:yes stop_codon:yes gene_type:complete
MNENDKPYPLAILKNSRKKLVKQILKIRNKVLHFDFKYFPNPANE